jgi:hypothetical protein
MTDGPTCRDRREGEPGALVPRKCPGSEVPRLCAPAFPQVRHLGALGALFCGTFLIRVTRI